MKNNVAPTIEPIKNLEDIINSKRRYRGVLNSIKDVLFSQYQTYSENNRKLENVQSLSVLTSEHKDSLKHCYTAPTKALEALRVKLFSNLGAVGKSYCPYCLISEPKTLDHYLPKELFPEFSVLPANLIPCCFECNNTRGKVWINSNDDRTTINTYFDAIENKRFLFAKVQSDDGVPEIYFYIENRNGIDDYIFQVIFRHFDSFQLSSRYRNQFNRIETEIHNRFSKPAHAKLSDKVKKQLLSEEVQGKQDANGVNYWEAVIIEALADTEFIYQDVGE